MRTISKIVAWVYDFLAEDVTLLVGMLVAIGLTIVVVRLNSKAAGLLFWGLVLVALAVSIMRTLTASKS